jgi:hypothetical protein
MFDLFVLLMLNSLIRCFKYNIHIYLIGFIAHTDFLTSFISYYSIAVLVMTKLELNKNVIQAFNITYQELMIYA